jgi:hypothetical protein
VTISRRERWLFALIALVGAFLMTHGLVQGPGYTDAFYHLNAANRVVTGQGWTDPYLWTYIGAPDNLPAPSHLYWMPMTSLLAAVGMGLLNAPGNYAAAQWPFALLFAGTVCTGFWLGERIGGTRRHAWLAGLITLFSGYFTRFWGVIDTFAPYALFGSVCLVFIGLAVSQASTRKRWLYCALAGVTAGLAHLTRADGILLLLVGWSAVGWTLVFGRERKGITFYMQGIGIMTLAYLLVMLPWFIRNMNVIGTPMPLGGAQGIWFTEYNDLFNYPPNLSAATFFANGLGTLFNTRWEAFAGSQGILSGNLGTLVAVEGLIVMTPLMLVGLWRWRKESFLRGFWIYALGLHLAMTLIFPYPGYRGGLLHSSAALVPWWAILGVVGVDDCVEWLARRRRWNTKTAKRIFSGALVAVAIFLSYSIGFKNPTPAPAEPATYREVAEKMLPGGRLMINDPAQFYYFTGIGGVVLPNEDPSVIQDIARQYQVDYLLIEAVTSDSRQSNAAPQRLWPILSAPPDFLTLIPMNDPTVRLYAIHY